MHLFGLQLVPFEHIQQRDMRLRAFLKGQQLHIGQLGQAVISFFMQQRVADKRHVHGRQRVVAYAGAGRRQCGKDHVQCAALYQVHQNRSGLYRQFQLQPRVVSAKLFQPRYQP